MRLFLVLLSLIILGALNASAQSREDIVLTGGPALRFMEHGKGDVSHDGRGFNFVDAGVIRLKELRDQAKAKNLGVPLVWFNSKAELVAYFNKGLDRDKIKIGNFDYFG